MRCAHEQCVLRMLSERCACWPTWVGEEMEEGRAKGVEGGFGGLRGAGLGGGGRGLGGGEKGRGGGGDGEGGGGGGGDGEGGGGEGDGGGGGLSSCFSLAAPRPAEWVLGAGGVSRDGVGDGVRQRTLSELLAAGCRHRRCSAIGAGPPRR